MARGDRLEVVRRLLGSLVTYRHHGIDMGDNTVIHARPYTFRKPFSGGSVVRTSLEEFAEGSRVWPTLQPTAVFPPDEIAARAESHVGRDGYCPVVDNCEHFANWCATGDRRSRQVDFVASCITAGAVAGITFWAAGATVARAAARRIGKSLAKR